MRKWEVRKMVCAQVGRAQKNVRKKIVRKWVQIPPTTCGYKQVKILTFLKSIECICGSDCGDYDQAKNPSTIELFIH